jgi:hypothetical protein
MINENRRIEMLTSAKEIKASLEVLRNKLMNGVFIRQAQKCNQQLEMVEELIKFLEEK